jgi:methylene-tetrahydromethanopterin dehydrogenase
MEKASILHLITAAKNASPFDVNMAVDAGFNQVVPYTSVELKEVAGLVQDAIFSRSPSGIKRESLFIGGRDIDLAMDMLEAARNAMFSPFEISVLADPSGAFTTAAAMMAKVEQHLNKSFGSSLSGQKISIFGATGLVAGCAAVISARNGANVELVAHRSLADVQAKAASYNNRYNTNIGFTDGTHDELKKNILQSTDIAICAATAGIRVLTLAQMAGSPTLKIVTDVNAVPPSGAEGVDVMADGVPVGRSNALGIGAMAIGNVKYNTQHNLLKRLLETEKKLYLDFLSAFEEARAVVENNIK